MRKLVFPAIVSVFALVIFGLPLLWVVMLSFKSRADFTAAPLGFVFQPTLANYVKVFSSGPFLRYFFNSIVITALSVGITLALAAPAAYALARFRFWGKEAVLLLLLGGLAVPIHITLLPLLKGSAIVGLSDSLSGLSMVYAAFGLAITVFILKNGFEKVPVSLLEASRLDGCGEWRTFWHIALPLTRPALAVAAIYNCVINYNEFAFALTLLRSGTTKTLPLGIMCLAEEHGLDVPATAAAISLAAVPVFIVFLLAQRHIIAGLTSGAVKA